MHRATLDGRRNPTRSNRTQAFRIPAIRTLRAPASRERQEPAPSTGCVRSAKARPVGPAQRNPTRSIARRGA